MNEDKSAIPDANELSEGLRALRGRLGEFRGRL
jgi:hypothetical protein